MFFTQTRLLCCSVAALRKSDSRARVLNKLITGSSKPKKPYFKVSNFLEELEHMREGKIRGSAKLTARRQAMLNNVFLEHITEMMSSGLETYQDLQGLGISITQVKVATDLSAVYIYWVSSSTRLDDIEGKLKKAAQHLRHELSQLRLIGHVPKLDFLKDKLHSSAMNVEHLLAKAGLGLLADSSTTQEPLPHLVPQFGALDIDKPNGTDLPGRSNILGVDRLAIMNDIKLSMAKFRKAQRAVDLANSTISASDETVRDEREETGLNDIQRATEAIEAQKMAAIARKLELERKIRKQMRNDQRRLDKDMARLIADPVGSTSRVRVPFPDPPSHPSFGEDTQDTQAEDKVL